MPTTTVLLLMIFVSSIAGMCFDNTKASPPREVMKPAHTVGNMEGCKAACWSSSACHAFSYNPISSKCVQFGATNEGTCAGKGFYPYVKCAGTVDCEYFSMAKSSAISVFPRCQVKSDFFITAKITPKVCDTPPPEIICEQGQCFCENPNQHLVVKFGKSSLCCSGKAYCFEENKYRLTSPKGSMFLQLNIEDFVCTTIARTTHDKCMCDMPLVIDGLRSGDKLCGDKKIRSWGDAVTADRNTNLRCTPEGWSDGVKMVKPEYVFCE